MLFLGHVNYVSEVYEGSPMWSNVVKLAVWLALLRAIVAAATGTIMTVCRRR